MSKTTAHAEPENDADGSVSMVPKHIGIIMDGNHRWAQKRHLPGAAGHRAGAKGGDSAGREAEHSRGGEGDSGGNSNLIHQL